MDASEVDPADGGEELNDKPEENTEKPEPESAAPTTENEKEEAVLIPPNSGIVREISVENKDDVDDDVVNDQQEDDNKETGADLNSPQPNPDSPESAEHDLDNDVQVENDEPKEIHEEPEAFTQVGTEDQEEKPVPNEAEQNADEVDVPASQPVQLEGIDQAPKEDEVELDNGGSAPYYGTAVLSNESSKMDEEPSTESKVSSRSIAESNLEGSVTLEKSDESNEERVRLIEEYKKAVTEHRIAKEANLQLQTKLAEYFRRKKADAVDQQSATSSWGGSTVEAVDYEQRYNKYLASLSDLRRQFQEMQVSYQKQIEELKNICSQRQEEVDRAYSEFTNYKYSIGKKALNSRTGRPINPKDLAALFAAEQKKEAIVMQVRLDNIKLKNEVNKVEAILKAKEELADGLHLIDFEQLKIENQTYNEKIEERNEELSKLRRKISSTVQIMTHVKEKLQAVQHDNAQQKQRLSIADAELTFNRDQLTKLKQNRDRLRAENAKLKRSSGLLGKNSLLLNYEDSVDAVTSKKATLKETRDLINQYQQQTFRLQKKIESLQESKSLY